MFKTCQTCQFNENILFICRLKSEHNWSGKNARHKHVSWMMHLKQGIKYLNVETRLLFAHLLKFPATRLLQRFYVYIFALSFKHLLLATKYE